MAITIDGRPQGVGGGGGAWPGPSPGIDTSAWHDGGDAGYSGIIGTTDAVDLQFHRNGSEVARLLDDKLLIGNTTSPLGATKASIELVGDGKGAHLLLEAHDGSLWDAPQVEFRRSRGTLAVPTASVDGDVLGSWHCRGYSGGWKSGSEITWYQLGAPSGVGVEAVTYFNTYKKATGWHIANIQLWPDRTDFSDCNSVWGATNAAARVNQYGLSVKNGTLVNPSISGINDTDTGFTWGLASNELDFVTGGNRRGTLWSLGLYIGSEVHRPNTTGNANDRICEVESSGGHPYYQGNSFSNTPTISTQFNGTRGRGTSAAPAAVQSGDILAAFNASGYRDGLELNVKGAATLQMIVDGAPGGFVPGRMEFRTSSSAANTQLALTIDSAQNATFEQDVEVKGKLTVGGLIDPTGIVFDEQSSSPWTPAAGKGAIWVKDDSPNNLYFTDDAGSDWIIGGAKTWPLLAPNGTVGAPVYSFIGDTDTGLYSAGADDFRIATGGVDRIMVNSSNVQIEQGGWSAVIHTYNVSTFHSDNGNYIRLLGGNAGGGIGGVGAKNAISNINKWYGSSPSIFFGNVTVGGGSTPQKIEVLQDETDNGIVAGKGRALFDFDNGFTAALPTASGAGAFMVGNEFDLYRQCDLNSVVGATEVGHLIKLRRGVLNPNTPSDEGGGFLVCTDAADASIFTIDKLGDLILGNAAQAKLSQLSIFDGGGADLAGEFVLYDQAGNPYTLWVDATGVLRIEQASTKTSDLAGATV